MIKELPLLMQSDMVNAALRKIDPKTNTRRTRGLDKINENPDKWIFYKLGDGGVYFYPVYNPRNEEVFIKCPYGQVDDHLWIRERQEVARVTERLGSKLIKVKYMADSTESNWLIYPDRLKGIPKIGNCLSYGGYRESSRLTLEITDIRVERVKDITPEDALNEGIRVTPPTGVDCAPLPVNFINWSATKQENWFEMQARGSYIARLQHAEDIVKAFKTLWNSINEKPGYGWDFNPWIWVIEFKLIKEI